jgi:hypothetical protein
VSVQDTRNGRVEWNDVAWCMRSVHDKDEPTSTSVGVTNVWFVVDVVDWGCNLKWTLSVVKGRSGSTHQGRGGCQTLSVSVRLPWM